MTNRKTEEELREDEELQLALALSQSEAEQQKVICLFIKLKLIYYFLSEVNMCLKFRIKIRKFLFLLGAFHEFNINTSYWIVFFASSSSKIIIR